MKRKATCILSKIAAVLALGGLAVCTCAQNLVSNGSFSEQTNGTQFAISSSSGGKVYDQNQITGWRFFSVGNPPISNFTATVVSNPAGAGDLAMRLDFTNTIGATGVDWGIDRWVSRVPLAYGVGYTFSFDAAYIDGSTTLRYAITAFTNNASIAGPNGNVTVTNRNFQRYTFNYTPPYSNVTVDVRFMPQNTGSTNWMSLCLDNVQFTPLSILNGSFEAQAAGTARIIPAGATIVDSSTFSNWRFFTVNPPLGSTSTATIVSGATDQNVALRYDVINTAGSPADYALDRDNAKVPVTYGIRYKVSFDAANISGGSSLSFSLSEHKSDQSYTGQGAGYSVSVTSPSYQTFSYFWTPLSSATAYVNPAFRIRPSGGYTASSMKFDNVRIDRAVAAVTLDNLLQTYDGTAKSVSAVTDPPGLTVNLTYNGSSAAPSGLGSYTVVGTVQNASYEPTSVTNTLLIVTPFAQIPGGSFEDQSLGTMSGGGSVFTDSTNFAPWRIFNVAPGNGTFFTGTVVSAASDGTRALRLDVSTPELANGFCVFDRDATGMRLPIVPGTRYLVSFDLARLSGSLRLRVTVPEFNDGPAYLNKAQSAYFDLPGTNYQRCSFIWTAQDSGTTQVSLGFTPWCVATNTAASYLLDNVCFTPLGEVALRDLSQPYDGTPTRVSAVTDPPDLPVSFTYNGSSVAPSNGGVYTVVGRVTNALYACSVTNTLVIGAAAQLKTNGGFEAQPAGTTVSFGPEGGGNSTSFSGWRLFNVGTPAVSNFTALIVPSATEGVNGMQLSLTNLGGVAADHALDTDNAKLPVSYGTRYKVSFDAAKDSGSRVVGVGVAEYRPNGSYAGVGYTYWTTVNSSNYQNFSFIWTPVSNVTTMANLGFRQQNSGFFTSSVMRFDNVRFEPLVAAVSLTNLVHAYNAPSKAATATTVPGGFPVTFTYNGSVTVPAEPGRYTVVGTVSDAYFSGSVTDTLIVHGPPGTRLFVK
jgi:hypothetical protein